jgi:hypothetical protein
MLVGERIAVNYDMGWEAYKVAKRIEKLDNRPQAVEPLQHAIRPNLLGAFISDTIQHHAYIIALKIPQILNLSYANGSSYYYNIAKNQKCGRKLSSCGKRRSSNFWYFSKNSWEITAVLITHVILQAPQHAYWTSSPEINMILNGNFH